MFSSANDDDDDGDDGDDEMLVCLLQLFKCFNHLGLCPSVTAVRKNVDLLVQQADEMLQMWKKQVELQVREFC